MRKPIALLDSVALFTWIADAEEIEFERNRMEELRKCKIAVHKITTPVILGTHWTRVEWKQC